MLIAFAFSFIGILLVYGNYKFLRRGKALTAVFSITILLGIAGIYLLTTSDPENPYFLMVLFSPLAALILLQLARIFFRKVRGQEIILYLGGFLPKRFEERFVTRLERLITFLITVLSLAIAYLAVYSSEFYG
jgi:drug/metabolite transporter (DMT)-like permease